jgi:4-hydroxymandelate oxidase
VSTLPALEPLPPGVRAARDYAAHAQARLDPQAWAYFEDAAGTGHTAAANQHAWERLQLLPRVLRGVERADTAFSFLGRNWPVPWLVAPMALQRLAHGDGELATALAAAMQGAGMVVSTQTSVPLPAIAAAVRSEPLRGPLWFQLYLLADRGATLDLLRQAESAGYEAIVLTVDAALRATRPLALPPGVGAVHLAEDARFTRAPTWDDVAWLQAHTRLPLLLKGVLHPEDAREAVALGVAGLIVSNHGGRILDGAAATAAALPAVLAAVDGALPVLVDGGIRCGADAVKALALGARGVLLGRPVLHGLAAAGVAGAAHVLKLFRDEFQLALAQCGLRSAAEASRSLLLE